MPLLALFPAHSGSHALGIAPTSARTCTGLLFCRYLAGPAFSSLAANFNKTAAGGFTVVVSADEPSDLAAEGINWLRVPWREAPISLNMRV